MNVIEDLGVGEVRVHSEVAGNLSLADPVDQITTEDCVVSERLFQGLADFFLAKEAKLQGIMFAAGADIVGEEVVLRDLVPLLGVVPEPPRIGDQQTVAVNQGIIDGDDTLIAVSGGGSFCNSSKRRSLRTWTSQSAK